MCLLIKYEREGTKTEIYFQLQTVARSDEENINQSIIHFQYRKSFLDLHREKEICIFLATPTPREQTQILQHIHFVSRYDDTNRKAPRILSVLDTLDRIVENKGLHLICAHS
jgi:hypothetical protein